MAQEGRVFFEGKEVLIEFKDNNESTIINPDWSWDDEAERVLLNISYDIPYRITVKNELLSYE